MSRIAVVSCLAALGLSILSLPARAAEDKPADKPMKVLLLSGKNNHDWKTTTPALQKILEDSKLFTCEILSEPEKMDAKMLADVGVIVSNWNNWPDVNKRAWGETAEKAFMDFLGAGKGVVMIHAASSTFYTWPEFQNLVGTWWKLGQTGHGPVHKFTVKIEDASHPITAGLKDFEVTDELWHRNGTAGQLTVLASAMSDKSKGGSGQVEPALHVRTLGQGRCANLLLGHDVRAMTAPGFKALLLRSAQWAACGKVTTAAAFTTEAADAPAGAKAPAGETQVTGQESLAELLGLAGGTDAKLASSALEAVKAKARPIDLLEIIPLLSSLRVSALRGPTEDMVQALCAKIPEPDQQTRPLLQCLPGANLPGRCSILRILGRMGGRDAAEMVRLHLNHFDPRVRSAVAGVLLASQGPELAGEVLKMAAQKDKPGAAAMAVRAWYRAMAKQEAYDAAKAVEMLQKAQASAKDDAEKQMLAAAIESAGRAANYAATASPSSPDDVNDDGSSIGDIGAIDGDLTTYWDELDKAPLYVYQLDWPSPVQLQALRVVGWGQHDFAPKDFDVLCDGKVVKQVRDARYKGNCLTVPFEPTACKSLTLRITGCYGGSPAIRELEVFDAGTLPPPPRFNMAYQARVRSMLSIRDKAGSGGPEAAIDGSTDTYWDQDDNKKLYRLEVGFQRPVNVAAVRIVAVGPACAPKTFDIVCDGKVVKQVADAKYADNACEIEIPPTVCKAVELNITGCHGASPGIRELEVLGAAE